MCAYEYTCVCVVEDFIEEAVHGTTARDITHKYLVVGEIEFSVIHCFRFVTYKP